MDQDQSHMDNDTNGNETTQTGSKYLDESNRQNAEKYNETQVGDEEQEQETEVVEENDAVNVEGDADEKDTDGEEEEDEAKVGEEAKQAVEIPDSMAIKHNFLEQLSDKLASIKNNSLHNNHNSNNNKKWSKNNSGNLQSATTPVVAKSDSSNDTYSNTSNNNNKTDLLSETDLLNSVDMCNLKKIENDAIKKGDEGLNELNKSKSKWGMNCGGDSTNKHENHHTGGAHKNLDQCSDETDDINQCDINKKLLKRKAGTNFTRYKTDGDKDDKTDSDELGSLPSHLSKKSADNHSNLPPASSQIQVTYWKEDAAVATTKSGRQSSSRGQKQAVNQRSEADENRGRTKNDAITDRILIAAKAASSTKSYKS